MRQGGLYEISCLTCQQENKTAKYIGESARTLYDRGVKHLTAHRCKNPESVLIEHEQEAHSGQEAEWSMKAIGLEKRNLHRQAKEGHLIANATGNILNRRGEWGQNLPQKIAIDDARGPINFPKKRKARGCMPQQQTLPNRMLCHHLAK